MGCLFVMACGRQKGDNSLLDFTIKKLNKQKGTFQLNDFKDVTWDKVYILGPYTNEKMYDNRLKPYAKDIIASGILTDDGLCFVMLFNGDKLVSEATFDRRTIDFSNTTRFTTNYKLQYYNRDKASFPYHKKEKQYIIDQL